MMVIPLKRLVIVWGLSWKNYILGQNISLPFTISRILGIFAISKTFAIFVISKNDSILATVWEEVLPKNWAQETLLLDRHRHPCIAGGDS